MTGLWKTKVSGWNNKDQKRKKQTRKHLLKDKVKPLIRKFVYKDIDKDFIYNEANKYEVIKPEPIVKHSGWIDIWKVDVQRFIGINYYVNFGLISEYSHSLREAYCYNSHWYDIYTNELIDETVKKISFLYKEEILYPKPLVISKKYYYGSHMIDRSIFIYGKPLEVKFHNIYGFYSTKNRKYAQKMVSKAERGYIRNFIKDADWDKEIKTHSLSKSIAWEIW